jgi:hypothetical protein
MTVDPQLHRRPPGAEWADEVPDRRLEARRGEYRRMEVDKERTQVAHGASQALDHVPHDRRVFFGASRLRAVGHGSQRESQPSQLLHRTVVEVRRDATPLPPRGHDRVREQALPLLVAPLQPARERPEEWGLHREDEHDRTEDRRRERPEQPACFGCHRAEALVDLEQHRRARWGPDPRVRLDQPPLRAVELVLGPAQVRDLHLRAAVTQQLVLLVVQRKALADLRRVVGVEDASGR